MGEGVVTRVAGRQVPPYDIDVALGFIVGPAGSRYTEDELELAWAAYAEELGLGKGRPGLRSWAFWKFQVGREPPDDNDQPIRLAELGLLRDDEVAALAEGASEAAMRLGTADQYLGSVDGAEPHDRGVVERFEAVKRALAKREESKVSTNA
jgi:hypothetical protein